MFFFEELKQFIKNILDWIYLLVGLSFFFFLFGLRKVGILGRNIFLPLPTIYSFSSQFLAKIQADLLPPGVKLIVTNPLSAFSAQIFVSLLLAFVLTFPFFLYKIIKYLSPALFKHEKKAIKRAFFPSFFLFLLGCLFAYFLLIPSTFKLLYPFTTAIGAIPFFSVNEFITLVFGLMLTVGLMFLLPFFMKLLSLIGLVNSDFWKKNWRYAFLVFLVFSSIITPDGTGVTMMMLTIPLISLYSLGMLISQKPKFKRSN